MIDETPVIIDITEQAQLPHGILHAYQWDRDVNEAVAAFLRAYGKLPAVVYRLRKQAFIPEATNA